MPDTNHSNGRREGSRCKARSANEADGPLSPPVAARSASKRPARPLRRRRRRHTQFADQAQEIGALEAESAGRVRAIAAHLVERGLDEPSLEVTDGTVIAGGANGRSTGTVSEIVNGVHARARIATAVPRQSRDFQRARAAALVATALSAGRCA
jgi:hypothetical protein